MNVTRTLKNQDGENPKLFFCMEVEISFHFCRDLSEKKMVFSINSHYHKANINFLPWSRDAFVLQIPRLVLVSGSCLFRCCGSAAVGCSLGWQQSSPLGAEGQRVTVPLILWFSVLRMSSCIAYCSGRCFVLLIKILCFTDCNTIEFFPQLFFPLGYMQSGL